MGAFEYTAVDAGGKETKGVLEGETARQVRQLLREKNLFPTTVAEVKEEKSTGNFSISFGGGISASDLALFTRQLATLVNAAMPLETALKAVAEQTENQKIQSIVLSVRSRVMEGHTFADGLHDFPKAFPELYIATVAAGEQSGYLDTVLERLADYTEARQELRQKVQQAMIYPAVLIVLAFLIVTLMLVYVVPKVVGVFTDTGRELPVMTQVLIGTSEFLQNYGLFLGIALIIGGFVFKQLLKQPGPRETFDRVLLKLPLIGRLVKGFNTARFTRTFSILTGAGVPVLDCLRISSEVIVNMPMREAVEEAAHRIREGAAIGSSLGKSGYFPPICVHLISSGESSGQLENMLGRAAQNQEREMDGLIATMLGILEPAVIVGMGVIVTFIVLSILLPIFQLNELVG
jgi:general secretion pathway protein F